MIECTTFITRFIYLELSTLWRFKTIRSSLLFIMVFISLYWFQFILFQYLSIVYISFTIVSITLWSYYISVFFTYLYFFYISILFPTLYIVSMSQFCSESLNWFLDSSEFKINCSLIISFPTILFQPLFFSNYF